MRTEISLCIDFWTLCLLSASQVLSPASCGTKCLLSASLIPIPSSQEKELPSRSFLIYWRDEAKCFFSKYRLQESQEHLNGWKSYQDIWYLDGNMAQENFEVRMRRPGSQVVFLHNRFLSKFWRWSLFCFREKNLALWQRIILCFLLTSSHLPECESYPLSQAYRLSNRPLLFWDHCANFVDISHLNKTSVSCQ